MAGVVEGASVNSIPAKISQQSIPLKNDIDEGFTKVLHKKAQADNNLNAETVKKNSQKNGIGTDLALKKQMKNFARDFERHIISSMWQAAYASSKEKDGGIVENLYGGQYMSQMVNQAYGEDGGPLADAMYEKLVLDYGQELKEPLNDKQATDKKL